MNTKNIHQQDTEKKKWVTPELKVYGDVIEITAEMTGGQRFAYSS
jgi:hypothetical protein